METRVGSRYQVREVGITASVTKIGPVMGLVDRAWLDLLSSRVLEAAGLWKTAESSAFCWGERLRHL